MTHDHPCAICKTTPAPFGYRMAGHYSRLDVKSYLWACEKHRQAAEERWRGANAPAIHRDAYPSSGHEVVKPQARRGGAVRSGSHHTEQGALDL